MANKKPAAKSAHLQDLESRFEQRTRRFSAFEVLGIEPTPAGESPVATPAPVADASAGEATQPPPAEVAPPPTEKEEPALPPSPRKASSEPRQETQDINHGAAVIERVFDIPLEQLAPSPDQPRVIEDTEADQELLESIRTHGVLNPIHVRPIGANRYEVIGGQRRWRASQLLGKKTIPALIRERSDDQAAAQALIDNLVRKDLSPLEEARAFKALIDRHGYQQTQLAERVGCHKSRISLALSMLKLPPSILDLLFAPGSRVTAAHAEALLPLLDQPPRLERVAKLAVQEHWSRDRIRQEVQRKPRVNAGAQSVRFQERGANGQQGFILQVRFHPNRPHDIPMIEEALAKASSYIKRVTADGKRV